MARYRLIVICCLLLFVAATSASHGQESVDPSFVSRVSQAVNRQDIGALRALTQNGISNDYAWAAKGRSLVAPDRPWQVKPLEIPWISEPAKKRYVNVSKYHPCESTSDHIYPLVSTDSGLRLGREIPETDTTGFRIRDHKLAVRFDLPNRRAHITDRIRVEQSRLPFALVRLNSIYQVAAISRDGAPVEFRQAGGIVAIKPMDAAEAVYDLKYSGKIGEGPEDYILPNHAGLTAYWYAHTGRLPATHEVAITVPRGWAAIGQGELLGKTVGETETTTSYQNRVPVCYFTIAAGKYTVTTRKLNGINVSAWLLRPDSARANEAIDTAAGAIDWFSRNFSPYPYTSYAVVESDVFPAALECYSFTLSAANYIPLAVVHEVAHTWWGGIVPNTYTRSLWNESFAEYSDGLYGRVNEKPGLHEFNARVMGAMIPMLTGTTLATAHDAMDMKESIIGYGKGSVVLENLERLLGRQKMIEAMQQFVKDHKVGEDAEWQDFIRAVTAVAGDDWAAFFPPWLNRADLPNLRLAEVRAEKLNGKFVVSGKVLQRSPAFWISLPLVVESAGGSRTDWIPVKGTEAAFRFETTHAPRAVWLDPQRESLRAMRTGPPPPTLLKFHTATGPILAVYATGGSEAEVRASKSAASAVTLVNPSLKVNVKADRSVTESDLKRSSVIFLGKPSNLRIPASWRDKLPLRYTDSAILDSATGLTTSGRDLWGISVQSNPANSRFLMVHAGSTSPQALRGFRFQDSLTPTESRFIATSTGKLIAARRPASESGEVAYVSP